MAHTVERATDIARILNDENDSPYEKFIKFPGSRKFKGGIQLSTFVSNLKPLVKPDGEFSRYSLNTLDSQVKILKNFFSALQFCYGDDWFTLKNPFIFASGFGAAIDFFISKVLPQGYAEKKFSVSFFKQIINLDKANLIWQTEVRGSKGDRGKLSAREYIKTKLIQMSYSIIDEDEFEF